jgi:hypothetical protein
MTHAILDKRFQLLRCVGGRDISRVFLASDLSGRKFVVKFLFQPDLFFEEMARYYACDDVIQLPRLVYNYPSFRVARTNCFFDRDLLRLFGFHGDLALDRELQEHEKLASPMADVSALVFEYVDGPPLSQILPDVEPEKRRIYLQELAGAVADLHRNGEIHGDLSQGHVLLERATDRVKLVDLGYHVGKRRSVYACYSPEHPQATEPGSDVYMFAKNFLEPFCDGDARLLDLVRRCTAPTLRRRPSMAYVAKRLSSGSLAGQVLTTGFRWGLPLAAVILIAVIFGMLPRNSNFLQKASLTPENSTTHRLEKLFWQPFDERDASDDLRHQLWTAQSVYEELHGKQTERELNIQDFQRPVAMALMSLDQAYLVGRSREYHLGKPLLYRGKSVYLAGLEPSGAVLGLGEEFVYLDFPELAFKKPGPDFRGVLIWPNRDNLPMLARTLQRDLGDRDHRGRTRWLNKDAHIEGWVFGVYPVGDQTELAQAINEQLSFELRHDIPYWSNSREWPLYYSFAHFNPRQSTVAGFRNYFQEHTGIEMDVPDALANRNLRERRYPLLAWDHLLHGLGFEWKLEMVRERPVVRVRHFAP